MINSSQVRAFEPAKPMSMDSLPTHSRPTGSDKPVALAKSFHPAPGVPEDYFTQEFEEELLALWEEAKAYSEQNPEL